jgi:hypothetical protein
MTKNRSATQKERTKVCLEDEIDRIDGNLGESRALRRSGRVRDVEEDLHIEALKPRHVDFVPAVPQLGRQVEISTLVGN